MPQSQKQSLAHKSRTTVYDLSETGKNLGVRRRYPPVLNDARYTGPVMCQGVLKETNSHFGHSEFRHSFLGFVCLAILLTLRLT
jgi:hypothetical protein